MHDILDLHEFFVEGGDQKKSHVLLHISEPSTPEEKNKGYFFALSEIERGDVEQIKCLQDLIDGIESRYFDASDSGGGMSFEEAIEHANRKGHHVLEYERAAVHCFVGVLRGNSFAMSCHGAPHVELFYEKNGTVASIDVASDEDRDKTRLFSQLLEGSVNRGDTVYIATPGVHDFFSADRLAKLIAGRTTKETAEHIQKVLSSVRSGASFGGIVFKIIPPHEAPRTGRQPKYIAPDRPQDPPQKTVSATRALATGVSILWRGAKKSFLGFGSVVLMLFILATNKGGQRALVLKELRMSMQKKKQVLADLPLVSKILLCAAVVSGLIFALSAGYFQYQKAASQERQHHREVAQAIRDKKDAADKSSIYGDTGKAMTLLTEASALLETLPNSLAEKSELEASVSRDIETLRAAVQKRLTVSSEIVADLTGVPNGAPAEKLVAVDDTLIAFGGNNTVASLVSQNTKRVQTKKHEAIPRLLFANTPKEQDIVLFASGERAIAGYDPNAQAFRSLDISFPTDSVVLRDLFVYNQRLYTLDTNTNQIYRHAKTQTGYDKGTPWIKNEGGHLQNARSMAIDGDVFVLTSRGDQGVILKFTAGVEQAFTVSVDPPLTLPEIIWTYNNVNHLYVLESANKRVVVLDKAGALVQQYTDPTWKNPTGMVVDEAKKTVYVLDDNKIYKFGL